MKKSMISLAVLMAMLLAACGGAAEEAPAAKEEAAEAEKATLTMATNAEFPPYEFMEGGEVVGIDAEVAGIIADELGMELVIENVDFDSIIPGVKSGKFDMGMAGMTVTEDRLISVNFTTSYATGIQSVIVPEGSPITSVDDLFADGANNKVGVQLGTTGDIYSSGDIEGAGLGAIERFNKGADAVMALKAGKVDCVIIDNLPAQEYVDANEGLVILDTDYAVEDYAIAINKDNAELLEKVDAALVKLIDDGTVQEIVNKYISAE